MKKTITFLLLFFFLSTAAPLHLYGDVYTYVAFLEHIEKKLKSAETKEQKVKLITQPLDKKSLTKLDENKSYVNLDEIFNHIDANNVEKEGISHPLAIAISIAYIEKLTLFLEYIDDINSHDLQVDPEYPGSLNRISLARLALEPVMPFARNRSVADRMQVIDLLGRKGLDFNAAGGRQAMAFDVFANLNERWKDRFWDEFSCGILQFELELMKARALLYGLDPYGEKVVRKLDLNDTSNTILNNAFNMYLELVGTASSGLRPVPAVTEVFKKIRDGRLAMLGQLAF